MKPLVWSLALLLPLAAIGCFDPDEPPCAFACGDNGACPDDYMCLPDGFCHLHGMPGACGFPDAAMPDLGVGDLSTSDGNLDMSNPDLPPPPDLAGFMSFDPCPNPSDYTTVNAANTTITFGNSLGTSYSPKCLAVEKGTVVSFAPAPGGSEGFSTHPLSPSTRGTTPNPIPAVTSDPDAGTVDVTFASSGFFPYFCTVHGANNGAGMAGVVQVLP